MINLNGAKILVLGVANPESIAAGCALSFHAAGAELAITYLNDKARPHVKRVAYEVEAEIFTPYDAQDHQTADALFDEIEVKWGRLDGVLHSIAYCPLEDLQRPIAECSASGFLTAMEITCHSLMDITRRSIPLMQEGGSITTISYLGGQVVLPDYNVMGPVKAALEATVRTLAVDLGPKHIRVNALSPGPMATRAASGLSDFDHTLKAAVQRAPLGRLATPDDVGAFAAFLASPLGASVTGGVHFIDGGLHKLGWDHGHTDE
ncbi:MAG: enoyl-ACP reductase FabI [Pseudomonadota bacterium]